MILLVVLSLQALGIACYCLYAKIRKDLSEIEKLLNETILNILILIRAII